MSVLWIRNEIMESERRAPIVPIHAALLIRDGHHIFVESSDSRIFKDNEYAEVGCEVIKHTNWLTAPKDALILGLKHLPVKKTPLIHSHAYFAHAYNKDSIFHEVPNATLLLKRFKQGGGIHYDLEFLVVTSHSNLHPSSLAN